MTALLELLAQTSELIRWVVSKLGKGAWDEAMQRSKSDGSQSSINTSINTSINKRNKWPAGRWTLSTEIISLYKKRGRPLLTALFVVLLSLLVNVTPSHAQSDENMAASAANELFNANIAAPELVAPESGA